MPATVQELLTAEQLIASQRSPIAREFSWSPARHKAFKNKESYWSRYYESWGGWHSKAPDAVRQAYVRKHTSTIPDWIGREVHGAVAQTLRAQSQGHTISYQQRKRTLRERVVAGWRESRAKEWSFADKGLKNLIHLDVHDTRQALPKRALSKIVRQAERAYMAYSKTPWAKLAELSKQNSRVKLLEVEKDLDLSGRGFRLGGRSKFKDVPIWAQPDFVLQTTTKAGKRRTYIVDWKIGKILGQAGHDAPALERHRRQLLTYALQVQQQYGVDPSELRLVGQRLSATGRTHRKVWKVTKKDLQNHRRFISRSMQRMTNVLEDKDIARNFMPPPGTKSSPPPISPPTGPTVRPSGRTAASEITEEAIESFSKYFTRRNVTIGAGAGLLLAGIGFMLHRRSKHYDTAEQRNHQNQYWDPQAVAFSRANWGSRLTFSAA